MGSIAAELRVGERTYPVLHFEVLFTQDTGQRGQASAKVRHGHLAVELDVPADDQLLAWAAAPQKRLSGTLITRANTGEPREHVAFTDGYCVGYDEFFRSGDQHDGAYRCRVRIAAPGGFTLGSGAGGGPYVAPAARDHGTPPVVRSSQTLAMAGDGPGDISTCPPNVTARLQAQVELAYKSKGLKSRCTQEHSCPELLASIAVARACVLARETIMNQCFGGGNKTHQDELRKRKDGLANCEDIFKRKCAPAPEPAPVPRTVPVTKPVEHKPNPAVPGCKLPR